MLPKVIVITGPTATGKSDLAIRLAKKINGEIISADSMQIYKGMDIGTAKIKNKQEIKHYMIDIVSPEKRYNVSEYKKEAENCIQKIINRKKTPIIVGGTGLYIDSLIYGIDFQEEGIDLEYREKLNKIVKLKGLEELYKMAFKIDPEATTKISSNDSKRIIRILEIYKKTGKTKTIQEIESRKNPLKYEYIVFALNMERDELYNRINKRVDKMIENGLIEEVEFLSNKYKKFPTAFQGIRI